MAAAGACACACGAGVTTVPPIHDVTQPSRPSPAPPAPPAAPAAAGAEALPAWLDLSAPALPSPSPSLSERVKGEPEPECACVPPPSPVADEDGEEELPREETEAPSLSEPLLLCWLCSAGGARAGAAAGRASRSLCPCLPRLCAALLTCCCASSSSSLPLTPCTSSSVCRPRAAATAAVAGAAGTAVVVVVPRVVVVVPSPSHGYTPTPSLLLFDALCTRRAPRPPLRPVLRDLLPAPGCCSVAEEDCTPRARTARSCLCTRQSTERASSLTEASLSSTTW